MFFLLILAFLFGDPGVGGTVTPPAAPGTGEVG